MEGDYVRKDLKLRFLKFLLLCSLMNLWIQDVSPTENLDCEISAQKCQPPLETKTRTVTPKGSKVTFNCSIKNGGKVQDMTWKALEGNLSANNGLFLYQNNSKDKNLSRECFSIKCAIPVKNVEKTSSPVDFYPDGKLEGKKELELKCIFKGWPRPRVVWYNPDNEQIINGSEGFYISEQLVGEDSLSSVLRNPNINETLEGRYKCIGMNNITDWKHEKVKEIDLKFRCFWPEPPQISSPEVSERAYVNVSLKCLVTVSPSYCYDNSLRWYFNNSSGKLESGEKYHIQERETHTKCKTDFILTIVNVTEADEGNYKCQWLCDEDSSDPTSSTIQLKVFPPSVAVSSTPSSQNTTNSTSTAPADTAAVKVNNKSADKWIPAIAILTSGLGLVLIVFTAHHFISKKSGTRHRACKNDFENGVLKSNQLFVSYSSKDMAWINENLIPILEKQSISYSIHTRDFELGLPIVQNMADSVYGSRKVLIVLSDNYLASNFCREELHMAVQREADSQDSSLILVAIDKLKKKKLPGALRNKHLLDFEKLKIKQDWEKKLLNVVAGPGAKVS